jgi:hypothetical protein
MSTKVELSEQQEITKALLDAIKKQSRSQELQHKQMKEDQQKMFEAMLARITVQPSGSTTTGQPPTISNDRLADSIAKCITSEFFYDPESNLTFKLWFSKYRDLFDEDAKELDDAKKVRLLLRKLGAREHQQYVAHILPKEPKEIVFKDTVEILERRFGLKETVFRSRFKCLRVAKNASEDYFSCAGRINTLVNKMEYKKMSEDEFKCLLYVVGLNATEEKDVWEKLLALMEKKSTEVVDTASGGQSADKKLTINELVSASERFVSLRADNREIEHCAAPAMTNQMRKEQEKPASKSSSAHNPKKLKKKYPCRGCGSDCKWGECNYTNNYCEACDKVGHKEGYCSESEWAYVKEEKTQKAVKRCTINKKTKSSKSHRRFVSVFIKGTKFKLQFDTASDPTIISFDNWKKIGSPKLCKTDQEVLSASKKPVKVLGVFSTSVTHKNKSRYGKIFVTKDNALNIFGIDFITKFNYWTVPLNRICDNLQVEPPACKRNIVQNKKSGKMSEKNCHRMQINSKKKFKSHVESSARDVKRKIAQNEDLDEQQASKNGKFRVKQKVFVRILKNKEEFWEEAVVIQNQGHGKFLVEFKDQQITEIASNQLRKKFGN